MTTYYVATLARYVLVDAENEVLARELGRSALHKLYAEDPERIGTEVPITIRTIRPATSDEIDFEKWNREVRAREIERIDG